MYAIKSFNGYNAEEFKRNSTLELGKTIIHALRENEHDVNMYKAMVHFNASQDDFTLWYNPDTMLYELFDEERDAFIYWE